MVRAWGAGGARVGSGGARVEEVDFFPKTRHKIRDIFRSNFLSEKWASDRCSQLWRDDDARAREGGGSGARVGGGGSGGVCL